jgi:hypothetical protein
MHKTKIGLIILALLLTGVVHASAVSVNLGSTDPGLFERVATQSQYGIENWTDPASPIYDPAVLKAYGKVPPIHNATQMNEFADKLRSIRDSSWNEIDFYPNGHVVQYGSDPRCGYFYITLYNDGTAYSEKHTQKIYDIVDNYATKNDLQDVPVVFVLTNSTYVGSFEFAYYMYDLEDEPAEENASLEQITEDTNLQDTNDTNKQAPALGVLGSLLMVFAVNLFCKKRL